tara:strand:- start:309 stop:1301 length:993 start_codon:yes stop_codon:yes gene_type:complete
MVSKNLLELAMRLAKQLGANSSKFLGTRTKVDFIGSGPKDGNLFLKNINLDAYQKIGNEKMIPDINASMGYLTGGKLNEIQANRLIDNMAKMVETNNKAAASALVPPTPGTGGLGALRETPEIASALPGPEVKPMNIRDTYRQAAKDGELTGNKQGRQNAVDLSPNAPPGTIPAPKQKGNKYTKAFAAASSLDMQGKPLTQVYKNIAKLKAQDTGKQTAGGELLLNVFQGQKFIPRDVKGFLQSGNQGDSIKIVEKYFGPKVADLVPLGATAEEMSIFTQRVLNNLVDAKGFRPGDPKFNRLTADFVEKTFASGGRVGFSNGGLAKILEL